MNLSPALLTRLLNKEGGAGGFFLLNNSNRRAAADLNKRIKFRLKKTRQQWQGFVKIRGRESGENNFL